jgi:hypothetical protein
MKQCHSSWALVLLSLVSSPSNRSTQLVCKDARAAPDSAHVARPEHYLDVVHTVAAQIIDPLRISLWGKPRDFSRHSLPFAQQALRRVVQYLARLRCLTTQGSECMQKQVLARARIPSNNEHAIMRVELVLAKSVWEYQPGPKETFYKITCSMPNLVASTRSESSFLMPLIWQHIA